MSEQYGPFGLSRKNEDQRLQNIATAKKYMSVYGPARNLERTEFVSDDGIMILPFSYANDPRDDEKNKVALSFKQLGEKYQEGGFDWFPEWRLSNPIIYSTPDPDVIYVECDGQSMRFDQRFPDIGYYHNHYMLKILFQNGKLHNVYEVLNTAAVFKNFGWNKEPEIF